MTVKINKILMSEAKMDSALRQLIKADIEKAVEIGKPRFYSPTSINSWTRIHNRIASEGAIKIFCNSIGDVNPLFQNAYDAQNSVHGGVIAPPAFLSSVSPFIWQGAMYRMPNNYNTFGFDAGAEIEWFKTIRLDDSFRVQEIPTKVVDISKNGRQVQFLLSADKTYTNQKDEVVAIVKSNVIHVFFDPIKEKEQFLHQANDTMFPSEKVEEWIDLIGNEPIRGANIRFWQDVTIGEQLPSTYHVFNSSESAVFMAAIGLLKSFRRGMESYRNNDNWKEIVNPNSGIPDFNTPHLSEYLSRKNGSSRIISLCVQMEAWLCKLLTNWMGDLGFLKKLSCQVRQPLFADSLAICSGEILDKYTEGEEHLAKIGLSIKDHNDNFPIKEATATVILPTKGAL